MQEIHRVCWEAGGAAMAMCMSAREDVVDQGTCHSIVGRVRQGGGDGGEAARRLSLRRIRLLGGEDGMGRRAEVRRACREESGDIFSAR